MTDEVRRAKTRIDGAGLAKMLDLPSDTTVIDAWVERDPFAVVVLFDGPWIPPVPSDAEAPCIGPGERVAVHFEPGEYRVTCPNLSLVTLTFDEPCTMRSTPRWQGSCTMRSTTRWQESDDPWW